MVDDVFWLKVEVIFAGLCVVLPVLYAAIQFILEWGEPLVFNASVQNTPLDTMLLGFFMFGIFWFTKNMPHGY